MRITDHIHALRLPFQVPAPSGPVERFVYVYLLYAETVRLIDAGTAGAEEAIFAYLRGTGRDPRDISTLVLTHAHPDHLGAARAIQQRTGCRVAAHPAERAWIEDTTLQARERPVPGFDRLVGGPVPVDLELADGQSLAVGEGLTLEVIHTPGHSAGSVSLFLREEGALFSGDALSMPGEMPIYDDVQASMDSIARLCALPGVRVLLSAWDEPQYGEAIQRRMAESLDYLRRIHEAVLAAAGNEEAVDPMALAVRVLPMLGLPPGMANPLVARTFMAHLRMR